MPFVRYARDRRGYETLYVMHAFEGAEKNARVRVLYACRTVPHAKVGRNSIDEGVQRRIELAYPALKFDWPKLLKEAAASAPRPERTDPRTGEPRGAQRRERKGRPGGGSRAQGGPSAGKGARPFERGARPEPLATGPDAGARADTNEMPSPTSETRSDSSAELADRPREIEASETGDEIGAAVPPAEPAWGEQFETEEGADLQEGSDAAEGLDSLEQFDPEVSGTPQSAVLEALEELDELVRPEQVEIEATRQQPEEDERLGPVPTTPGEIGALTVDRSWPVVAIVGSDRALVLRGRYIELAHRVLSRVSSPAERSRLMREVSRLNPESWQTEQEARTALAGLEAAYARIAEQLRQQPRA